MHLLFVIAFSLIYLFSIINNCILRNINSLMISCYGYLISLNWIDFYIFFIIWRFKWVPTILFKNSYLFFFFSYSFFSPFFLFLTIYSLEFLYSLIKSHYEIPVSFYNNFVHFIQYIYSHILSIHIYVYLIPIPLCWNLHFWLQHAYFTSIDR